MLLNCFSQRALPVLFYSSRPLSSLNEDNNGAASQTKAKTPQLAIYNACSLEELLESVIAMSDLSVPLDLSLERILESRSLQSEKEKLIHVSLRVGSALLDAASRSALKLAKAHNSVVWPLPPELTVKVLSCLDTTSLCYASATCTAFSKCISDPSCYHNIDLTRNWREVGDFVVFSMIYRAEKNLRALLQKLCLSHIHCLEKQELILALSNCLEGILSAVSTYCPSIERLCFDFSNFCRPPMVLVYDDLINGLKNLSSLSLRGCILFDNALHVLIKGLTKLRYADFSSSKVLKGFFLKGLGNDNGGDYLETLILRDCPFLNRDAIGPFLNDVIDGKWKSLRFLDVTSDSRDFVMW
ncbi:hypothetical protein LUZ60_006343 [Juncus effusus]|nr:hypothetical protein LUZ60_006343 [Juncus effusus]